MNSSLGLKTIPLQPAQLPTPTLCQGSASPEISGCTLHRTETSSLDVWEYTPGEFSWQVDEDQSTWILTGSAEVELGDGQCLSLCAGMTLFLPRGMPTRWVIRETLRTVAARGC